MGAPNGMKDNDPLNTPTSRKRDASFANRLSQFGDTKDLDFVVDDMKNDTVNRTEIGSFAINLNKFANTDHGDLDDVINAMKNDEHVNRVQIGSFAQSLNTFVDHDVGSLDSVLHDIQNPEFQTKVSIKTDVSLNENEISRLEFMKDNEMSDPNNSPKNNIIANIEIDEYENSDDGWISEEEEEENENDEDINKSPSSLSQS